MSGKNRTSPEKIRPLVHPDMSGKYGTGPNLFMAVEAALEWFTIALGSFYTGHCFAAARHCAASRCRYTVRCLWAAVVNHGSRALFSQFLYRSVLMRQHVAWRLVSEGCTLVGAIWPLRLCVYAVDRENDVFSWETSLIYMFKSK